MGALKKSFKNLDCKRKDITQRVTRVGSRDEFISVCQTEGGPWVLRGKELEPWEEVNMREQMTRGGVSEKGRGHTQNRGGCIFLKQDREDHRTTLP